MKVVYTHGDRGDPTGNILRSPFLAGGFVGYEIIAQFQVERSSVSKDETRRE
jgi:hypothetical protein